MRFTCSEVMPRPRLPTWRTPFLGERISIWDRLGGEAASVLHEFLDKSAGMDNFAPNETAIDFHVDIGLTVVPFERGVDARLGRRSHDLGLIRALGGEAVD